MTAAQAPRSSGGTSSRRPGSRPPWRFALVAATAPTLVVVGDDDLIAGPVCADTMLRELADARLVTIRDAGHFVYVEQPAAFRAALTDFLL